MSTKKMYLSDDKYNSVVYIINDRKLTNDNGCLRMTAKNHSTLVTKLSEVNRMYTESSSMNISYFRSTNCRCSRSKMNVVLFKHTEFRNILL